jgi:choline dehydrogenase-like flavoprotein
MTAADIIIVGSGASAVHAAVPLVEAGLQVTMLDVGHEDLTYEQMIPAAPFVDIRRNDANQHRYFLGDRFEGIPLGAVGSGPQVTPPRAYMLKDSEQLGPSRATGFEPLESYALGGLGCAWGAVSFPFNDIELSRCGLPVESLRRHYEIVARRIGVSGRQGDDLEAMRGPLSSLQCPLGLDHNATRLLARYGRVRERSRRAGLYMGQSFLAVLSEPLGDRQPNALSDMDFWSNAGGSVYRPRFTLRELQRHPNFSYRQGMLVVKFEEIESGVVITGKRVDDGTEERVAARCLVLAAGSLGTTRIVLRSFGMYGRKVPFVCNSHTYLPCLHYRGLGTAHADRCHSLAQLTIIGDFTGDGAHLVQAQMYSHRSLQLFRLLNQAPLPHREGLRIMQSLAPHLVIWLIQHEDAPDSGKYCMLERESTATGDMLAIDYEMSPEAHTRRVRDEKAIARFVRRLGCWPLGRPVHAPHGASAHYAGQLPMTTQERPLTTEPSGRLRGTRAVYVADGSAFAYLPAKGPTLTLMANAHRIGAGLGERLRA